MLSFLDQKINIIDTPGLDDFMGEVVAAMRVSEVSFMCLNAHAGMEVGSEIAWRNAKAYNQPVVFIANQLDHEKADFDELVKTMKDFFSKKVITVQYPINSGNDFDSVIDVLKMKMYNIQKMVVNLRFWTSQKLK